jgi:hypothetical protein
MEIRLRFTPQKPGPEVDPSITICKPPQNRRDTTIFELPTVEAFCDDCKKPQPFNPQSAQIGSPYVDLRKNGQEEA